MRKVFYSILLVLLMICFVGCGQEKKSGDVNQIPTEVATLKEVEKPSEESQSSEPAPQAQPDKDYILAADDLSNLQLNDPTKPVYDK